MACMSETYDFSYLIAKIRGAAFETAPFRHVHISDFFEPEHFEEIVSAPEISLPVVRNDTELLDALDAAGYEIIPFPGCVIDREEYIAWHEQGVESQRHSACEGFGMALRLARPASPILKAIRAHIESQPFNQAIADKLGVALGECRADTGLQKYLDGYEISPHPDIRKKAATFMVNINPAAGSEALDIHTHYMTFRPTYDYVNSFWRGNPELDRVHVPWSWAETIKTQTANNSLVMFSPSDDTLHAVKAKYDHLVTQRTQLYGNLWYKNVVAIKKVEWEDLDLATKAGVPKPRWRR
jgi:hypothetical protein